MIELRLEGSEEVITYDPQRNLLLKDDVPYSVADERLPSGDMNLRVVLGKKCNYQCAYCIQTNSKNEDSEPRLSLELLADELDRFLDQRKIYKLSFWGGEPFLYLEEMRYLLDRLRPRLGSADDSRATITTNGSLLADSRVFDWVRDNIADLFIIISYDGPGQDLRGRNIFDDPLIVERVNWLSAQDRLGVSTVFTGANHSITALMEDLTARLGRQADYVVTTDFLQIVDQVSADLAANEEQLHNCLLESYAELISGRKELMFNFHAMVGFFVDRLKSLKQSSSCHAMSDQTLTLDLEGNLLVCQNITSRGFNPVDGSSYCLANIRDLPAGGSVPVPSGEAIKHRWATRCAACQVRHFCAGGCLVADEKWQVQNCRQMFYKCLLVLMGLATAVTGRVVRELKIKGA
jgi:radical SAM protein with 4Fe4S-binding SPASM domain